MADYANSNEEKPGLLQHVLSGAFVGVCLGFLFSVTENSLSYHLPQEQGRLATFIAINYWYYLLGLCCGALCGVVFALLFPRPFTGRTRKRSLVLIYIFVEGWLLTAYSGLSVAAPALLPTLFTKRAVVFPDVRPYLYSLLFPLLAGLVLFAGYYSIISLLGRFKIGLRKVEPWLGVTAVVAALAVSGVGYYFDQFSWVPAARDVRVEARDAGIRPNILMIMMDTLRTDHLSCYGYDRETSPHLDRLCRESTVFTQAFSPSNWTGTSHASLFTSLYPFAHGMHKEHLYLSETNVTLAELLSHLGYRTVGFTTNPWISRYTSLARGFEEFHETWRDEPWREEINQFVNPAVFICRLRSRVADVITGESASERMGKKEDKKATAKTTGRAIDWIRSSSGSSEPFFMFINFMETHLPYMPPEPFNVMHLSEKYRDIPTSQLDQLRIHGLLSKIPDYYAGRFPLSADELQLMVDLYDAEITYLDSKINEIVSALEAQKLLDETILIVTSDHGENFGDHGHISHDLSLYDSLLKTPLIIRYPDVFPPGLRVDKLVQNLDLLPTLLEILDVRWQEAYALQGTSMLPLEQRTRSFALAQAYKYEEMGSILEETYPEFDSSHLIQRVYAYRQDGYKYIRDSQGSEELYDVMADPDELRDLSVEEQERLADLRSKLSLWVQLAESMEPGARQPVEMSEEIRQRLRSLGYLQ